MEPRVRLRTRPDFRVFSRSETGAANMKCLFLWTGTFVLGLAALMCTTASISAQRGGGGGGRGGGGQAAGGHVAAARVGGGRAVARTGSIHYGARAGRDPVGPAVIPGHEVRGGANRNPYRGEYARHFRPGYRSMMLGDSEYYMYDSLPPSGCQTVLQNGMTYDLCDGVYYQPYFYGGQTMYLVVPM